MTWKLISTISEKALFYPKDFEVDLSCKCCNQVPRLINSSQLDDSFPSAITPNHFYSVITNIARCDDCHYKYHGDHDVYTSVAFDKDTLKWVNLDDWLKKQEWKTLFEISENIR